MHDAMFYVVPVYACVDGIVENMRGLCYIFNMPGRVLNSWKNSSWNHGK